MHQPQREPDPAPLPESPEGEKIGVPEERLADPNFEGKRLYWWDNQLKLSTKLNITSHEPSWTASSVINRTPYYAHIWNAKGEHRCLPPGYNFTHVGDAYNDKITHIGLYVDWC